MIVDQDAGCTDTTDAVVIIVVSDPTVGVTVADAELCAGGATTLTANVTGGTGTTHYQWQVLSGSWSNVGSDTSAYTTLSLATGLHQYRVLVSQDPGCEAVLGYN